MISAQGGEYSLEADVRYSITNGHKPTDVYNDYVR
jgi:hypothetical protein